jgi:hypothetical protein
MIYCASPFINPLLILHFERNAGLYLWGMLYPNCQTMRPSATCQDAAEVMLTSTAALAPVDSEANNAYVDFYMMICIDLAYSFLN